MNKSLATLSLSALLLSACSFGQQGATGTGSVSVPTQAPVTGSVTFAPNVPYTEPNPIISKDIAADFQTTEAKNLADLEQAYGLKLTAAQKAFLSQHKFLLLDLLDTSIQPHTNGDVTREFYDLYYQVAGQRDYKTRSQSHSVYLSSDVFFNTYNNLYVELLKEMENKIFFPSMKDLSIHFYNASSQKLTEAATAEDKATWTAVRNYFAVPAALFSTAAVPLNTDAYFKDGQPLDPAEVQADFKKKDATVDTVATATAYIQNLKLDSVSEKAVLDDIAQIFKAGDREVPSTFKKEFADYKEKENIDFRVDFSQFTPRGAYTSSSLRRQYFRGMNWYIQLPFFVKSPQLTKDAFAITQLMAEHPEDLKRYNQLESAITFLVGRSDDLMPADYMAALHAAKGKPDAEKAIIEYLATTRNPEIKSLAAFYDTVGTEKSADVLLKTKGMRLFSGKFIIDSYWTGQLTQGDEAIKQGYTEKLPPMASSLEVMALLGSDYARSKIPTLDFYKPGTSKAIDQAMQELTDAAAQLDTSFWKSNVYNGWLWTINGLFSFEKANKNLLPAFMQSPLWGIKTLMTGAGFWTELRHATILYAKQSFAELGGGPPACDDRQVPPPPKGYIEPQPVAYARLQYLAKRTHDGLKEQGYDLSNMSQLDLFVTLMQRVQDYTHKQLSNAMFNEEITSHQETDDYGTTCTVYQIEEGSDWEMLRYGIVNDLKTILPVPTEGPILTAKDRRAAIVADVHTGGDSDNPTRILYEGTGVPHVIIVAVKDANGPRYTIGFTYSQYEFTEAYGGQRMTDEDWQKKFYTGDDTYQPYEYTTTSSRPAVNSWFAPLFPK